MRITAEEREARKIGLNQRGVEIKNKVLAENREE